MYGTAEHEAELIELEAREGDAMTVDHPYTPCGCVTRAYGGDCAHTTSEAAEAMLGEGELRAAWGDR